MGIGDIWIETWGYHKTTWTLDAKIKEVDRHQSYYHERWND